MDEVIRDHVFPLVNKVEWKGFDPNTLGSTMSMSLKLIKHIENRDVEKLKMYLAICIKFWPDPKVCPIDMEIIKSAIEVIRKETHI